MLDMQRTISDLKQQLSNSEALLLQRVVEANQNLQVRSRPTQRSADHTPSNRTNKPIHVIPAPSCLSFNYIQAQPSISTH